MENIMDNREEILKAVKEDGKIYSCLLKVWRNDNDLYPVKCSTQLLTFFL